MSCIGGVVDYGFLRVSQALQMIMILIMATVLREIFWEVDPTEFSGASE